MRRGFCTTLIAVCAILLLPNVSRGQITFIPGPQRTVPNQPTFACAADFNGDGIADAVVVNIGRRAVVLLGSPPCPAANPSCQNQVGTFSTAVELPVGRVLRGCATGDFNGDGKQDIALTDFELASVLVIFGNGDGTFKLPPSNFKVAKGGPVAVATGNFDDQNGLDLVTANSFNNTLTTLFNQGANRGFLAQPNLPAGRIPRAVGTADFNSDGLDDIVVVNTGTRGADVLSIYLNNGLGSFQGVIADNFVVGAGAKALTIADFNDDGIPDVAVLNGGATGAQTNTFSLSILLNNSQVTTAGKTVGTGFFNVEPAFAITCPSTIHGIPVVCTPNDIEAADFDGNGENDLAVSFGTNTTTSGTPTSGIVSVFAGRGDGSFDFGTQVTVDLGPKQMVAADFTGDGSPDLLITESANNTVRILRSVAPPPRQVGDACKLGTQCLSGNCVDHTCCTTSACPSGERCDVETNAGVCMTPATNGAPCTIGAQCQSGFCVDGFCCGSSACASGLFCNTGACGGPAHNGTPCSNANGAECDSGNCVDGFCCFSASCPSGQACSIPGSEGQCTATVPNGTPCTDPAQCTSGNCVDRFCCNADACPAGQFCNTGQCASPTQNGTLCSTDQQCNSGNCVDGVCCASAMCQTGQFCNIQGRLGQCSTPSEIGTPCSNPGQCLSNFCVDGFCCTSGSCPPDAQNNPQFCNTGQCGPPAATGEPCSNDAQCDSGNCVDHVCCASASCPTLQACNVPPNPGQCTQKNGLGVPCTDLAQCQSGFCTDGVCCNTGSCSVGQICGPNGACILRPTATPTATRTATPMPTPTPQPTGAACVTGSQCVSSNCVNGVCCSLPFCPDGMACNVSGHLGQCVIVPTATPTVPLQLGSPCGSNGQCLSGHCTDGACCTFASCPPGQSCSVSGSAGQCVSPPPTSTPTPLPLGSTCSLPSQCASSNCTSGVCCTTDSCSSGQACNVPGHLGQCTVVPTPTQTPTPMPTLGQLGDPCDPNNPGACASGNCTDGTCCDTDGCADGQRCDIFGFEGFCSDLLDVDGACDKGTDCLPGLLCVFDSTVSFSVCSPPPTPTPTLFPLTTPVPTLPPEVHLSRSGGCSIGDGTDRAGLWLIAALPLVFWLRRRLVGAGVRTHGHVGRQ